MEQYKKDFIEFIVASDVLTFGEFTTKSGRKTPYFINTGKFCTGGQLAQLGRFYADAILEQFGGTVTVLFGPAYKGIPLVVTTAIALSEKLEKDIYYCFNRKEAKNHGEGGVLIGYIPKDHDRVVIVEDVITAGTSVRQTMPLLTGNEAVKVQGLVVAVDRMERGAASKQSALQEIAQEYSISTGAIVTLEEIVKHLYNKPVAGKILIDAAMKQKIDSYRKEYGADT